MDKGRFMVDANGKTYWKNGGGAQSAPASGKKGGEGKGAKAAKGGKGEKPAPEKVGGQKAGGSGGNTQEIESKVLNYLNTNNVILDTGDFSTAQNISKDDLDPVLKSLTSEDYIVLEVIERKLIELTDEGNDYAKNGSPEFQFVNKMAF